MSHAEADETDIIKPLSAGRKLHLVPSPEAKCPQSTPVAEMRELLNDLKRRQSNVSTEDGAPDAA